MKKFLIITAIILLTAIIAFIIDGLICNNTLTVRKYEVKNTKSNAKLRYVFISDLHNKEFGEGNIRLVNKIREQNPDFIALGGDFVTSGIEDDSVLRELLPQLVEIAPTYCVLGNHELRLKDKLDFEDDINSTGAVLLDNESVEFEKDGEKILIGGLSDFPYYEFNAPDYETPERYFWEEFKSESETQFSVLLHHQPEYIGDLIRESNIDIVSCGHTHGGLFRIPFIGGLYAPSQGWFPKYDRGEFDFDGTKMIISAGLGNSNFLPRINNLAEIAVIYIN